MRASLTTAAGVEIPWDAWFPVLPEVCCFYDP